MVRGDFVKLRSDRLNVIAKIRVHAPVRLPLIK